MSLIRYSPPKPNDDRLVVWFDIDNTLYPPNEQVVSLVQGNIYNLKLEPEEARALHQRYYTEYGLSVRGLIKHHDVDPLDFDAKCDGALPLEELLTPDPAVRKLLEDIDPSKARIWALTNAYKTHAERVLKILKLDDLFEGLVYCDYGAKDFACKPERRFYDRALELARTTAKKSYFVDDNFGNVRGAKWAHCAFLYDAALDAKALAGTGAGGGVGDIGHLKPEDGVAIIHKLEDLRSEFSQRDAMLSSGAQSGTSGLDQFSLGGKLGLLCLSGIPTTRSSHDLPTCTTIHCPIMMLLYCRAPLPYRSAWLSYATSLLLILPSPVPPPNLQPKQLANPMVGLLITTLVLFYTWNWPGSRRRDMPPGPQPLPIIGNLLNLKPTRVYEQLRQLNIKYGPIASLKIGSSTLVVIGGDGTHIRQLFDKRGSIYSNRPLQMATEVAGRGDYYLFQQNTNKWRSGRKSIVQHFSPSVMKSENFGLQEAESVQLLYDFLHRPEEFMSHPMRYTTSVLTCLAFGVRCESHQDATVQAVEEIMKFLGDILVPGGKPPVEDFPWLNYLPEFVSPWRAKCKHLSEIGWQRGLQGFNSNNLAYKLRLNQETNGLTRHEQAFICGIVLEGGTDIVAAVILACLLALIHDPRSQKRAQDELDALFDDDTLPSWQHERSLPFIRAIIKETIRWKPPLPMAVAHRLEQDDYYEGYYLPKGSSILCNTWAIHSSPERFDEPERFNPERFVDYSMSMAESVAQGDPFKRDHFAFGAGRRVCPGIQTAEQDVFIALSRLLWAFNFSTPPGVEVSTDYHTAFVGEGIRTPAKFPIVITPRSEKRVQTIEREVTLAREVFSQYAVYNPLNHT
ncbi:O-methylsterigmatocystin oxidoreductase [Ceratobasidium theobromae]|uniref:O-methylsterigmatocystin oxidoreductase n=1 Tax=Ceratobasidium theobromae TaxID=1582974 RepID=A0A5N5QS52_9AGAM|nr:O-methylsterigmatocystin oxidoreductase [Ceratobasidium theobromae]